jgi:murein DD-endopeptidase MepM/ murein hydrolase activator NlpD
MAVPITLETVGGNHVILDVGGGYYAFYAHLVPGSVKVKVGDRVKKGQQVGLLGNSGNSTAPHLHFHMGDKNSPLGSEGLPFLFDKFDLLDWPKSGFGEMLKGWKPSAAPVGHRKEVILENMIVRFP